MIDQEYLLVFFTFIPIIITWFLIDIIRKISIKLKVFAIHNERSSHDKIVPIKIIMVFINGVPARYPFNLIPPEIVNRDRRRIINT